MGRIMEDGLEFYMKSHTIKICCDWMRSTKHNKLLYWLTNPNGFISGIELSDGPERVIMEYCPKCGKKVKVIGK